jgi:AcrR family transcriptional regulator
MAPVAPRRPESLSRDQIVATAVEVLDASGESGLTFRVLSERLATGPGAIYWHVANKGELLAAATDAVVLAALAEEPASGSPEDRVRAVALGLFDAVDAHPWVAAQLSAGAWQAGRPRIVEAVGRQVRALGVPQRDWFVTTTVLVQYVLGAAAQNAANAQAAGPDGDREAMLDAMATTWESLDHDDWSFTRSIGDQMRHHDDREQFLAGIDILLAGLTPPDR